jgi:HK97 family phage portal protein
MGFPIETLTDVSVTPEGAMALNAAYACIRLVSTSMMLPCQTIVEELDGRTVPADVGTTTRILSKRPNPDMTSRHFFALMAAHLMGWGNHYSAKIRVNGRLAALYPLNPGNVEVYREDGEKRFKINGEMGFTSAHILHVPYINIDNGLSGMSPISMQRERLAVGLAQSQYQQRLYSQGTLASLALTLQTGTLSEERRRILAKEFAAHYSGGRNAHRPLILEQGMGVEQLSLNPVDAQFIQQVQLTEVEVARMFGVPASMIDAATQYSLRYDNPVNNDHQFVKWTLGPIATMIEACLSADEDLFGSSEASARFNLDALLRADIRTRAEVSRVWIESGVKSPNEIRSLENMPARVGGDEFRTAAPAAPAAASVASVQHEGRFPGDRPEAQPPQPISFSAGPFHIHPSDVRDLPAPVVNVEVIPQEEREQLAPVVHVNVPEQPTPIVNVDVDVPRQEAPQVTVNVPEQPAPVVNVEAPNVEIDAQIQVPDAEPRTITVERGADGRISSAKIEPKT